MSKETLSVVRIKFKKDLTKTKREALLKLAEELFEAPFKYEEKSGEHTLEDVNWTSGIYDDDIETFYKENKKYFEEFECSLYYLADCPFYIYSGQGQEEIRKL